MRMNALEYAASYCCQKCDQVGENHIPRRQPNSQNCYVCCLENDYGLQLIFFDNGVDEVWSEYAIPERYEGYPGVAHGGLSLIHI